MISNESTKKKKLKIISSYNILLIQLHLQNLLFNFDCSNISIVILKDKIIVSEVLWAKHVIKFFLSPGHIS